MKVDRDPRFLARWVVLASLALASCGGGGELAGVDSGGTGSFAVGSITGFGSVVVNDIRYDDSRATVLDEHGTPRAATDLKLGMVVEVEGSALVDAPAGSPYAREGDASQIRVGAQIVGPLQAVNATTSQITVLGQTLDLTPSTIYGDELAGGVVALALLPPGSILEVHGFLNPANGGRHAATRIDLRLGVEEFRLHGMVRDLDPATRRFNIGAARVDYVALGTDEARAAGVVEGGMARVRLGIVPRDDGTWPMLQAASSSPPLQDREIVDVEGLVTSFTAVTTFAVNGVPVDASRATIDASGGQLVAGVRIRVEGRLLGGVLVADEIKIERVEAPSPDQNVRPIFLSGPISALDTVNRQFRIRGVTVSFGNSTFVGGSLADLRNDTSIDVAGRLSANGSTVDAVEIRFGAERAQLTNPGKPGNQGKPGDTGKPNDPGKPGESGKPDNPAKPDEDDDDDDDDDRGKPAKPEKPEKPDKPGKPEKPGDDDDDDDD